MEKTDHQPVNKRYTLSGSLMFPIQKFYSHIFSRRVSGYKENQGHIMLSGLSYLLYATESQGTCRGGENTVAERC